MTEKLKTFTYQVWTLCRCSKELVSESHSIPVHLGLNIFWVSENLFIQCQATRVDLLMKDEWTVKMWVFFYALFGSVPQATRE